MSGEDSLSLRGPLSLTDRLYICLNIKKSVFLSQKVASIRNLSCWRHENLQDGAEIPQMDSYRGPADRKLRSGNHIQLVGSAKKNVGN